MTENNMNEQMRKTCCFTGHRHIPKEHESFIVKQLEKTVLDLIDNGYIYFGAGGALGFDTLAEKIVLNLKEQYPQIKLILVLPCETQTKGWSREAQLEYNNIKNRADKIVYISKGYYRGCMHKRNRHLVDESSVCVCYMRQTTGGTAYTVNYAVNHGKYVINIFDKP